MRGDVAARGDFDRDWCDAWLQEDHQVARARRVERSAGAFGERPCLGRGCGDGGGLQFVRSKNGSNQRIFSNCGLCPGNGLGPQRSGHGVVNPDVAGGFGAEEDRSGQSEVAGNGFADGFGAESGGYALRIGNGVLVIAFGRVVAAVIGREDDGVVDPGRIKFGEQLAETRIERSKLQAHLAAFGAVTMADKIGCRGTDGDQVGGGATPEFHVGDEVGGQSERRGVRFG